MVAASATTIALALWVVALVLAGLDHDLGGAATSVSVVAFATVGTLVVWRRPEHRLGWLFCALAVVIAVMGASQAYAHHALVASPGSLPGGDFAAWLADAMSAPMIGLVAGVLPQLFPTGRPLSPRWRLPVWAAAGYIACGFAGNAFYPEPLESVAGHPNPYAVESAKPVLGALIALAGIFGLIAVVAGVATLALRWRRSRGDERQQLKWFLAGITLLPLPLALHNVSTAASNVAISVALVVIPATMGVAILRYRLYDLDLVVRRAFVYAVLTALVVGVYLGVVALGELAVAGTLPLGGEVLAAVAAAAALQPLRSRVQHSVDRLFYGDRSRPYDAVARLGRRLELAVDPDTVLPGVVETVIEALRVPYAAVELRQGDDWVRVAEHGRPTGDETAFPMTYQADTVGRMLVASRGPGEHFSHADHRLLEDLARHAGVAVHAVQTTLALRQSRAELVSAREEERRRLRRDLHDGLGPTLAGVTLGLHAARVHLRDDSDAAERLLTQIETQIEQAIADIRRLVYGLRPPALDQFGLVRAVQLDAARMEGADGLTVTVDAPGEGLGVLPAAIEVAAYRIATEAVTNVVRHAGARTCTVRFSLNGSLEVEVADDGRGLADHSCAGVGLSAMRERAAELGGTLTVESTSRGTRVLARLPTQPEA